MVYVIYSTSRFKGLKDNVTCGSGLNDAIPPPPDKYAN
jgi:hypothetical protein